MRAPRECDHEQRGGDDAHDGIEVTHLNQYGNATILAASWRMLLAAALPVISMLR